MMGYLCDPNKNPCTSKHCFMVGGECKITTKWEFATDGEQKKHPREDNDE